MNTSTSLRFASYARCSHDDQAEGDFTTIDTQRLLNEERVQALGGRIVAQVTDEGKTGTNLSRPGWKKLLALAERGEIDAVVVTYMSRLGRGDAYTVAEWLLRQARVRIELVQEQFTPDLAGRMHKRTKVFVDGLYADQVSEWTRTKQAQMVKAGYFCGGIRPYGCASEPVPGMSDTHLPGGKVRPAPRRIVADPLKAPAVVSGFALYLSTGNLGDVQRHLRKEAPERQWTISRVRALLQNRIYRGSLRFGVHVNDAAHPPIVPPALFDAVQARLQEAAQIEPEGEKAPLNGWVRGRLDSARYYLRGRIWCGHCGCRMTPASATGGKGTVCYYQCIRGTAGGAACPVKRVNADALHEAVVAQIAACAAHPSRLERALTQARALLERCAPAGEMPAARKALRQTQREIERILVAIKRGGASAALSRELASLEAREGDLVERLKQMEARQQKMRLPRPDIATLCALWGAFTQNWEEATHEERGRLFSYLVDRVEFQEKGKGSFALRLQPVLASQSSLVGFVDNPEVGALFAISANDPALLAPPETLKFALVVPSRSGRRSGSYVDQTLR